MNAFNMVERDNATYSWPRMNTGLRKSIPTLVSDCPSDLLIAMAKLSLTGSCFLVNINGQSSFNVHKEILVVEDTIIS